MFLQLLDEQEKQELESFKRFLNNQKPTKNL